MNRIWKAFSSPGELGKMLRFAIVGIILTGVDYAVFRSLILIAVAASTARLCSSLVSVVASYPIHRKWSFRSSQPVHETAFVYFATRALAALIIQLVFELCIGPLSLGPNPAFWITTVLYPVVNFGLARIYVFKK